MGEDYSFEHFESWQKFAQAEGPRDASFAKVSDADTEMYRQLPVETLNQKLQEATSGKIDKAEVNKIFKSLSSRTPEEIKQLKLPQKNATIQSVARSFFGTCSQKNSELANALWNQFQATLVRTAEVVATPSAEPTAQEIIEAAASPDQEKAIGLIKKAAKEVLAEAFKSIKEKTGEELFQKIDIEDLLLLVGHVGEEPDHEYTLKCSLVGRSKDNHAKIISKVSALEESATGDAKYRLNVLLTELRQTYPPPRPGQQQQQKAVQPPGKAVDQATGSKAPKIAAKDIEKAETLEQRVNRIKQTSEEVVAAEFQTLGMEDLLSLVGHVDQDKEEMLINSIKMKFQGDVLKDWNYKITISTLVTLAKLVEQEQEETPRETALNSLVVTLYNTLKQHVGPGIAEQILVSANSIFKDAEAIQDSASSQHPSTGVASGDEALKFFEKIPVEKWSLLINYIGKVGSHEKLLQYVILMKFSKYLEDQEYNLNREIAKSLNSLKAGKEIDLPDLTKKIKMRLDELGKIEKILRHTKSTRRIDITLEEKIALDTVLPMLEKKLKVIKKHTGLSLSMLKDQLSKFEDIENIRDFIVVLESLKQNLKRKKASLT
jgi:hypothetical protein